MPSLKKRLTFFYILFDVLSGALVWAIFYYYRKTNIEHTDFSIDENFYYGLVFLPTLLVVLYLSAGAYKNVFRRFRIKELGQALVVAIIASILIFFVLFLDDQIETYSDYYKLIGTFFLLLFLFNFLPRFIITSSIVKKVHKGIISFPTLIIGGNEKALNIYKEITDTKPSSGNKFIGYVSINGVDKSFQSEQLHYLGGLDGLDKYIHDYNIEEVVIAIESSEHEYLKKIVTKLSVHPIKIKIIPDMYDILSGSVKMTSIFGLPLIEVNPEIMPQWQVSIKNVIDKLISLIALIILSPFFLIISIFIKLSSKGPVFFKQERIGKNGKSFMIYKFRTMFVDAEKNGPQLSSQHDNRITPIGKFLRRTRIDEFPQFYNVLVGDMSLVGPRPERQFYIDQIMQRAPHYSHIQKIKPGITSWGQVKYGYAENVDQMVDRLKFDILYLENMSLALDFKIMAYTIIIVLKGSGK
jgi:exopolysaccharide biosynthesis polyprenyl glycosylphosphotransferase